MVQKSKKKAATGILLCVCLLMMLTAACSKTNDGASSNGNGNGNGNGNQPPAQQNGEGNGGAAGEEPAASGPQEIAGGRPVTLSVDLHGWMPTVNTEATAENPTVFLSTGKIAEEFMKLHPNVKIQWARTKPVGGLSEEVAQWLTTQVSAGTAPAIVFTWGNNYQDRGWYEPLDSYLDSPNEYVEGNAKWRELFPDYLMKHLQLVDTKQQVVAIPVVLYSGPPTGLYYNKQLLEENNLEAPKSWEDMFTIAAALREKGLTGFSPWGFFNKVELGQWNFQFSVGPAYAGALMGQTDYDGDGQVDGIEQLRATKAGIYNPVEHDYAREVFAQLKRMYNEMLAPGWASTDYTVLWNEGKVALREEGMWALQGENSNMQRSFDYGVVPAPLVSKDTSAFVEEVQYTERGPYQPGPDLSLNIVKPIVEANPDLKEAAVAFLKYLTVPENVSMMVLEQGAAIGAVRGTEIPPLLNDWLSNSFPIVPKANWPMAFTDEQNISLNKEFELWVKGETQDAAFFKIVNDLQQKGADDYIKRTNIDTTGW